MPIRNSQEHLRLLEMGIPVYPGDERIISELAKLKRSDAARYPIFKGRIAGTPMGGNVWPRFDYAPEKARQANLGFSPDKITRVVKRDSDGKESETVTEISEPKKTSDPVRVTGAGPLRGEPSLNNPLSEQNFWRNPIGSLFGYEDSSSVATEPPPPNLGLSAPDPRWRTVTGKNVYDILRPNLPVGVTAPVDAVKSVFSGAAGPMESVSGGVQSVGEGLVKGVETVIEQTARAEARRAAEATRTTDARITPPSPPVVATTERQFLPEEWKPYGFYGRDIAAERKDYRRAMKDIWFKMQMLGAIAQLTGGPDQSESFGRFQVEMLNKMMSYDNEDRLLKIHKGMYFNKDGEWKPPKNRKEAHRRAVVYGAGPEEASTLTGYLPEKTGAWQNWLVRNKKTGVTETIASRGMPEGYDPEEFTMTLESMRVGVEKFDTWKRKFDAKTTNDGRRQVAKRWARELKRQSGMPIVSPITEAEIDQAFAELAGDEIGDLKVTGEE